MRYDLTRLGEYEFEHLSQSLAIAVLGGAVSVFGDGPDGGREATFEGETRYPDPAPPGGWWNGYGVVQAKFKRQPTRTGVDANWFNDQVQKELKKWVDPDSSRVKRGRVPRYLVVTTNVVLSPDPGRGGIDLINDLIRRFNANFKLGLKGWTIWHHDQICRYLDLYDGIRRTYSGLTVTGDVLAEIQRALARLSGGQIPSVDFSTLLTSHAAKELMAQQWVRLGQAGHPTNQKLLLSDVAIDLPARAHSARPTDGFHDGFIPGIVAHIIRQGDTIRRPRPQHLALPHLAIVGGPGQGKTTVGQLLCQVYRVALLKDRPEHTLGPEIPDLLQQYRNHLDRLRIPTPVCRRWPLSIPLNEFSDALAEKRATSLLQYMAELVKQRSPINSLMLREWLREWPWLVVLDGLDEVAAPDIREKVLDAISEFFVDAAELEADLLVVATTRPQGYREEFSPRFYEHLTLQSMDADNALDYAKHLAKVRYAQDPDMRARVIERLKVAANEPITARLMRTPLQVTIISLLLERRTRAPQDRYALFEAYYNTLYDREIAKGTPVSRLLDEQRRNIDHLHERIGLLLQVRAEHAGEAESQLPEEDLYRLAYERLIAEEYSAEQATQLASQLVNAATDRLVMLVGRSTGTIGFEIRSLQELMAARALFSGGDQELLKRLKDLATSAHWRNTWLFAASRTFAQREHLRDAIITLLDEIDSDSTLTMYLKPGARLAVEMLDEDITVGQPRYIKLLIQCALRLLDSYPGDGMERLAIVLNDTAAKNSQIASIAYFAIESKIGGRGRAAITALDALAAWAELPGNDSIRAKNRIDRIERSVLPMLVEAIQQLKQFSYRKIWFHYYTPRVDPECEPPSEVFASHVRASDLPVSEQARLTSMVHRLVKGRGDLTGLGDPQLQELLVLTVENLDIDRWPQGADIQEALIHWHARRPIASRILTELAEPATTSAYTWRGE